MGEDALWVKGFTGGMITRTGCTVLLVFLCVSYTIEGHCTGGAWHKTENGNAVARQGFLGPYHPVSPSNWSRYKSVDSR